MILNETLKRSITRDYPKEIFDRSDFRQCRVSEKVNSEIWVHGILSAGLNLIRRKRFQISQI